MIRGDPNNFRFNASIETYSISVKSPEQDLSNATIPASSAGFVVELQWIEKGTSKITNQSQAWYDLFEPQ
jgi:hypothetical protein